MRRLYNLVFLPCAFTFLVFRWVRGDVPLSAFWTRLLERIGIFPEETLAVLRGNPVLWVHAASMGEAQAAETLLRGFKIRFPQFKTLFTAMTSGGLRRMERSKVADACAFFPLDFPPFVRRALRDVRPKSIFIVETELWPNWILESKRRGISLFLVNARISARSVRRYRWFPSFCESVLRQFDLILAQSQTDADRFAVLGAPRAKIQITNNLKYDVLSDPAPAHAASDSSIFVAGSTHQGEEEQVLSAYQSLKKRIPNLKLVLAPRHPERTALIAQLLQQAKVSWIRKSQLDSKPWWNAFDFLDCILWDTLGELKEAYSRASAVFVGGTLVPKGGHNLLEPAFLGKPVFFGPYTDGVQEVAYRLLESGGGVVASSPKELAEKLSFLLKSSQRVSQTGRKAKRCAESFRGSLSKTLEWLTPYLTAGDGSEVQTNEN